MLQLISPDYLQISLSGQWPPGLESYILPHTIPLFGQTPQGWYLFQDLYADAHACFINLFAHKNHTFYLLKDSPVYFLIVQLKNSLDCRFQNVPGDVLHEWGINLYYSTRLFAEVTTRSNSPYCTLIVFVPETMIQQYIARSAKIKKFEQQSRTTNHTIRLFPANLICSFQLTDLIKSIRHNTAGHPILVTNFIHAAFTLFDKKRLTKQGHVEPGILNKLYALKNFLIENITHNYTRKQLTEKFLVSDYHFEKTFAKIYGVTPFRLLKYYRMSAVVDALNENKMNLKELAAYYHYSYNALIRAFQNIYHQHPTHRRQTAAVKPKPRPARKRRK